MDKLFADYLDYHKTAWSQTTLKSEQARLAAAMPHLAEGPEYLYERLVKDGRSLYGIKTLFIRLSSVETWAALQGRSDSFTGFKDFLKRHRNRFKHAYIRKEVKVSYQDALAKINALESPYREAALTMLSCGLRISELNTLNDGHVIGKGGKRRKVYGKIYVSGGSIPTSELRRKLKAVGLLPHSLRKLAASKAVENGAGPADLCELFGWSNVGTSFYYLQVKGDSRLRGLLGTEDV